ncbi:MAG: hypothetical protein A3D67_00790 [Candidatus Lloydbacteria bacterium RIFCSPHIGHO2_02_FULL_51_22]|uniref:Phospho-N-acetylmuramoyl-pentapeptide-transferase n=2 Tax=Candidatus Lloydiibacteriota TaxID=1817910 RepID=A0A1G2DF72_9BACT|nr:MAG: hypothetical protein A3D67_00790 [Candidatus Lloydbacteria bacterium RIFCSPHIGHO2_02_FULL_51_22]OGZ16575.1 MAG: hypothetical protein A3G11_02535 [Candidatus Lloydbacteria bacterium RIFCSPLOWO2_12_FULL_51_9]
MEVINVVKILFPFTVAFFLGIALTPFLAHYLYKYKLWKKQARSEGLGGGGTPMFHALHEKRETSVPRMGGVVIWLSATITIFGFSLFAFFFPSPAAEKFSFLSRNQTWLPLFTLVVASLIGLVDDFLVVYGRGRYTGGGLSLWVRILLVLFLGALGAWWFYMKLGVDSIAVPFLGEIEIGLLFIPFFMLTMLALFSGGVIDGIDGLAAGVMTPAFLAYAGIAFFQNQIDLAAFSAVIAGGTLAFLWFNIPPARFYMSETGMLGLTTTLAVIAFLTKEVLVLPVIAFPLFAASLSDIIQVLSKKFRGGKKVFLIAPIHHHFEARGWPPYKVTMRFWIVGGIMSILGMVLALIS